MDRCARDRASAGARLLASLALITTAVPAQAAPDVPCDPAVWIDRALEQYRPGGKGPQTFHASSRLELFAGEGRPSAGRALVELYAFPDRARLEYRTKRTTAVTATDGQRAWKIGPQGPVRADAGHFVVPSRLRNLGGILHMARTEGRVECTAGAPEGRQRLLLTLDSGEMILVDIDAETGLIRRYEGESPGTTGKADVMVVDLDAWHRMDGHWVALELVTRVNGKLASKTYTQAAKVDQEIIEQLFKRPDGVVGPPPKKL